MELLTLDDSSIVCMLAVIYDYEAMFLTAKVFVGIHNHFILTPTPGKVLDL